MAEDHTISNVWMAYISNSPYIYPNDDTLVHTTNQINTGWHVIPNMFWRHLVTPAQWAQMQINYEAYHVKGIKCTIFNCVPMTTQLAIQGNTLFTAFNNSIYGMAYKDELYETSWHNWYQYDNKEPHNLIYKEGLAATYGGNQKYRQSLPIYTWRLPNSRAVQRCTYDNHPNNYNDGTGQSGVFPVPSGDENHFRPTGILWDPLNRPEEIMEIRPGKNAVTFTWECHACDEGKWFNMDLLHWWHPYVPESPYHSMRQRPTSYTFTTYTEPDRLSNRWEAQPSINDYTIPDYSDIPVVPMAWWWEEMKSAVPASLSSLEGWQIKYIDLYFSGTEYEKYKYGPTQWFLKMIPLFTEQGTHIECSAQISIKTQLFLACKKRRTAIFAPTWGPFNWKQLYTAKSADQTFNPALIRYRTGGAKRTWQNIADSTSAITHPRRTVYNTSTTVPGGSGQGSTFTTPTTQTPPRRTMPRSTPSAPPLERHPTIYPPLEDIRRQHPC
uniref:Capsid protein n=1 Tax=Parvoviridae sp. TaxID=1940570 RepID=A0A7D3QKE4_9VIRU|nr:MAG: hypothetical protein [Parvoviridae sp.]